MDIDVKPVCCVAGNGLRVGRRDECVLYGVLDLSLCVPASVCDCRLLGVDRQFEAGKRLVVFGRSVGSWVRFRGFVKDECLAV